LRRSHGSLDAFDISGGQPDARSAFSWSYQQLSVSRRLFRLLSCSWLRDHRSRVCEHARCAGREARMLMTELRDLSLVTEQQRTVRVPRPIFARTRRAYGPA